MDNIDTKVSTLILKLMRVNQLAFDTAVILNLERKFVKDEKVTLKVEGTKLIINEDWFNSLSDNDALWNIRHAAWHVIGFDELRVGDKDPDRWNLACDYWINGMLVNDSAFREYRLPENAAYNAKFTKWDKEKIYDYLEQNQQQQNQHKQDPMKGDCNGSNSDDSGNGDDNGNGDDSSNNPDSNTYRDISGLEHEIQNIIAQSAIQAKQAGNQLPPDINEYLDELYNPQLPWNTILEKYMNDYHSYDYSYQRIHKKFFPHGIILPTLHSERLGRIIIANDESYSVTDQEFNAYLGSIKNIKDALNPREMVVISFTTKVRNVWSVTDEEDISKIQFRGCGGTHIPCVFDYISDNDITPEVLIVFSDMESHMPTTDPGYDVIWIAVNAHKFTPPFGRVIHAEIK